MNPYVKQVHPLDDYRLELVFENGERRIFDVKPYLQRGIFTRCRTAPFSSRPGSLPGRWSGPANWISVTTRCIWRASR